MKLNSTVALTLVLLSLMVGAGLVSAAWGIALGRDALKGVTQPDTRPANNLAKRQGTSARREAFTILREEDIVASAKARINGTAKAASPAVKPGTNNDGSKTKFPMVSQSENIVLEVSSAQKQENSLILKVNLRNNGNRSIKFNETSLSVTDESGQAIDNKISGLPSELPSASGTVSSTINIPVNSLQETENISLNLKDEDQQIELDVPDIPVPR
ncbi:MAG: hypothetical protein WCA35_31100 [Kovacikia sp.]